MFEIFPGNYAWSQAALRAMFTGVSRVTCWPPLKMGVSSAEAVTGLLDRWTLVGVADRIDCPLLIMHGAEDTQVPVSDAEQLYAAARSTDKVLRIFTADEGGSAHCQNDNRVRAHDEIGD